MNQKPESEKREQWERLKQEHPEFADDLLEIHRVFGKPAYVLVEVDGEFRKLGWVMETVDFVRESNRIEGTMREIFNFRSYLIEGSQIL